MLKEIDILKISSMGKIKKYPKYRSIEKFTMNLIKASRDKDREITKYQIFMLGSHNFNVICAF